MQYTHIISSSYFFYNQGVWVFFFLKTHSYNQVVKRLSQLSFKYGALIDHTALRKKFKDVTLQGPQSKRQQNKTLSFFFSFGKLLGL